MARNRTLTDEQALFIVQELARWRTPREVAAALLETYGATITPQGIERYNPHRAAGADLAERWRAVFEDTRARYVQDLADVAVTHRGFRLRKLGELAAKAEEAGELRDAAAILEQAAKELGGIYQRADRGGFDLNVAHLSNGQLRRIAAGESPLAVLLDPDPHREAEEIEPTN